MARFWEGAEGAGLDATGQYRGSQLEISLAAEGSEVRSGLEWYEQAEGLVECWAVVRARGMWVVLKAGSGLGGAESGAGGGVGLGRCWGRYLGRT